MVSFNFHYSGQQKGDLKSACEATVLEFLKTDLIGEISDVIRQQLAALFGDAYENKMFAVRSSAAGKMFLKFLLIKDSTDFSTTYDSHLILITHVALLMQQTLSI